MRPFVDFYTVLGVHPSSSQEMIHAAYRRLAKRVHPDVSSTTQPTQKMQALNEAYRVLRDPRLRLDYDRLHAILQARQAATWPSYPSPQGPPSGPSAQSSPSHEGEPHRQSSSSDAAARQQPDATPSRFSALYRKAGPFIRAFLPRRWLWFLRFALLTGALLVIAEEASVVVMCFFIYLVFVVIDLLVLRSEVQRPG